MTLIARLSRSLHFSAIAADSRTLNYVRQVKLSFVMRLLSVVVSFVTTAILLRAISLEHYGIWSLLISVQAWIGLFDLGIGNGLRTRVAENLSQGRPGEAARLIGLAYLAFAAIFIALTGALFPLVLTADWQALLNITSMPPNELQQAIGVTGFLTSLVFLTNLINPVAAAVQHSAYTSVAGFANSAIFMLLALLMQVTGWASVLTLLAVQGGINVLVNVSFTVWFYTKRPEIRPHLTFDLRGGRDLVTLGAGFFVIQAAMLVLFATDRVLIVKLLGPEEVAQYDVAFKLFSLFITAHLMIAGPLWSAYTEAYHRGEYNWINRTMRGQVKAVLLIATAGVALVPLSETITSLWTSGAVAVDTELAGLMCLFVVLSMWNNTFGVVLNGIGRLRIQLIATTIGAVCNIPLSIFLVSGLHGGILGIVLATTLCIALQSLLLPWAVIGVLGEHRTVGSQSEQDV